MAVINKEELLARKEILEERIKLFQARNDLAVVERLTKELNGINYKLEFLEKKDQSAQETEKVEVKADSVLQGMYDETVSLFSPMMKTLTKEGHSVNQYTMNLLKSKYMKALAREQLFCKIKGIEPSSIRPKEFQLLADIVESGNEGEEG